MSIGFSATRRSALATVMFLALTTPFGIAAHLVSELAGLGLHDDAAVVFSTRHCYLAVLAVASLVGLACVLFVIPRADRRAHVAALVDELPFHGRGAGFALTSFIAQFTFFALTQLGEGCPLCAGDIVTGVFAAAVAASFGALAVACGHRRILEFALALVWYVASASAGVPYVSRSRAVRSRRRQTRRAPFSFRYRPPPVLLALA